MHQSFNRQPNHFPPQIIQQPQAVLCFSADRARKSNIVASWANHQSEVREAQKLRYSVFAEEMGAILPSRMPGYDIDIFDDYCEHLLVRDRETWQVVGTFRVLAPAQAGLAGRTYYEGEFDLFSLQLLREHMVELSRICVHKHYRNGVVAGALWKELIHFMVTRQISHMMSCISVPMNMCFGDNKPICSGDAAASIWRQIRDKYMVASGYRIRTRFPLPVDHLNQSLKIDLPPLLKGYLRLNAKVLGAPAWDANFNTADFPVLTRINDLSNAFENIFWNYQP